MMSSWENAVFILWCIDVFICLFLCCVCLFDVRVCLLCVWACLLCEFVCCECLFALWACLLCELHEFCAMRELPWVALQVKTKKLQRLGSGAWFMWFKAGYLFCKSFYKIVCAGYLLKICKLVWSVYLLDKFNDQTLAQRNRQLCGQTVHLNDNITLNVLDTRCSGFDRNLADKISAVLVVWLAWLGLKDCED